MTTALTGPTELNRTAATDWVQVPVDAHLLRHARVRQIVRCTQSLALAQKQAGWARLHTEYLTLSDTQAEQLMHGVPE